MDRNQTVIGRFRKTIRDFIKKDLEINNWIESWF